ncbi:hypothetical protein HMPREF0791_2034 [Staphylococcus epidermidis W23144]|nr:hypothetical protein HMPREF0791_2034 [Staphylococcus epidermidis W23144]
MSTITCNLIIYHTNIKTKEMMVTYIYYKIKNIDLYKNKG